MTGKTQVGARPLGDFGAQPVGRIVIRRLGRKDGGLRRRLQSALRAVTATGHLSAGHAGKEHAIEEIGILLEGFAEADGCLIGCVKLCKEGDTGPERSGRVVTAGGTEELSARGRALLNPGDGLVRERGGHEGRGHVFSRLAACSRLRPVLSFRLSGVPS